MKYSCKNPILYHTYNRIDVVKKVFKEIKKTKPKKLYISSDGPTNLKDKKKIYNIRKYISKNIKWKCKLYKIYNKKNLGPKLALINALNFAFKKEKKLIILEHDCLPDISFFKFCDDLLELYENEKKVKVISGNYICKNLIDRNKSYYFGYHPSAHGWATWRRTWRDYDISMKKFHPLKSLIWIILFFNFNLIRAHYFYNKFKMVKDNKIQTWDYQLLFSIWKKNGIFIRPTSNLSKHIGWGKQSYHGVGKDDLYDIKIQRMKFPLVHPEKFKINHKADTIEYQRIRKLFFLSYLKFIIKNKFDKYFKF